MDRLPTPYRRLSLIGLFFILLGSFFLLDNLNLLPANVLIDFDRWWPLILVVFGLQLFLEKSRVAHFIAGVLAICILTFVVLYIFGQGDISLLQRYLNFIR